MAKIRLHISKESKDLGDGNYERLYDISSNGIELYSKKDDFPMPWDAVCYIDGEMFMLDGDLGQQGAHKGYARVGIPLDRVMNYLDLVIIVDDQYEEDMKVLFKEYGWL